LSQAVWIGRKSPWRLLINAETGSQKARREGDFKIGDGMWIVNFNTRIITRVPDDWWLLFRHCLSSMSVVICLRGERHTNQPTLY